MKPEEIKKTLDDFSARLKRLEDAVFLEDSFSKRQVFKKEVQFLGKVYDKNGDVVPEINA